MTKKAVTSIIQGKSGIRIMVIPGARMLTIVTMRFMAVTSVPIPLISKTHDVEVDACARRVLRLGHRRVGEPARVGCAA